MQSRSTSHRIQEKVAAEAAAAAAIGQHAPHNKALEIAPEDDRHTKKHFEKKNT